ncbi:hypothetical protein DB789_06080 [Staphylococcus aureus]|nr:hypothetical protein DB789_06080 [Staphylococcus aureus]
MSYHEFYSCIPIFKYILAVVNDKESLHNKSLVVLYHLCPTPLGIFKRNVSQIHVTLIIVIN